MYKCFLYIYIYICIYICLHRSPYNSRAVNPKTKTYIDKCLKRLMFYIIQCGKLTNKRFPTTCHSPKRPLGNHTQETYSQFHHFSHFFPIKQVHSKQLRNWFREAQVNPPFGFSPFVARSLAETHAFDLKRENIPYQTCTFTENQCQFY